MVILELAEVPFLLDQLDVVVLAVELPLVRDVVRRADGASSMAALEAALVVHNVVHSNPLNWIDCLAASNTLLPGASEGARDFSSILIPNVSFWLDNLWLWGSLEALVQAPGPLEELVEVRPAVEHSVEGVVVGELECALAVVAAEAGLVVDAVVGGELVDEVHRLVAGGALGGGSLEGGRHGPLLLVFFFPTSTMPSYRGEAARGMLQTPQRPALSCCC